MKRLLYLFLAIFASIAAHAACVTNTPYAGCVHFAMRTDSSFYNNYTANPTQATKNFMTSHFYRTQVSYGYFENNLSWYPNAWTYLNSYGITYGDSIVTQHPEYVLHDVNGNPLYVGYACSGSATTLGHCSRYAGNIANEGFRQYTIAQHLAILQRGYKGVWLDDVNLDLDSVLANNNTSGTQTTPIDTNTGSGMSQSAWLGYWATFLGEYNSTIKGAGYEVQENSVWFEGGRPAGGSTNQQAVITASNQWMNIERGVTDGGITGGTGDWSLSAVFAYIDQVHAKGRYADIQNFNFSQGGGNNDYVPACYFLISTGLDLMGNDAITPNNWPANYDVDLGTPSGARYNFGNGIRRDFSRGFVVVTPPGTATTTFTLTAGQYTDTAGNPLTNVSIPALSGLIALAVSAPPVSPTIASSPTSWTFGGTTVGTTSGTGTVTTTNNGPGAVTFTGVALSGANASDFAIVSNTCTGSIASGAVCNTSFNFTPSVTGTRTANLTFTNNATGSPQSLALSGTGNAVAVSTLSFSNPSWTFGSHPIGETSGAGHITATNSATAPASFTNTAFVSGNAGDFAITGNTCTGTVAPSANCTVTFNFTPTAAGTRTSNLTLTNNATGSPQALPVTGTATAALIASLNFSNTSWAFGSQTVGTTTPAGTITLTNNGTAVTTLSSVTLTGLNPGDFGITGNTCGSSIAVSASCTVSFTFMPTASGGRSANLEFADNVAGSPQDIPLSGTGTAPQVSVTLALSFGSWGFGTHGIGVASGNGNTTATNSSASSITFSSVSLAGANPQDFTITSNACTGTLAPGAACQVVFKFIPTAAGARTASLNLASPNIVGGTQPVALSGTGRAVTSHFVFKGNMKIRRVVTK